MTSLVLGVILTLGAPEDVVTTGYCWHYPCVSPKYADGITASGSTVQRGVCAASWRVYPRGSLFFIPGYGLCRVEDTGRLVQGKHLDLFFEDIRDAITWGRKTITVRRVMETQETIGQWAIENFGRPTPLAVLRRSCDELLEAIELCVVDTQATRTMFKAMREGLKNLDNYALPEQAVQQRLTKIMEEVADTTIVNAHAAETMGYELQIFVNQKMDINRRRRWKQNGDGTGQHVEGKVDEDVILSSIDQEEAVA